MIHILFARHKDWREEEILREFQQCGIAVTEYYENSYEMKQEVHDKLVQCMNKDTYYFIFSFNFYPVIANAAYNAGTKYVCWQYDVQKEALCFGHITFVTNYVFMNNAFWYKSLMERGIETVYYLPSENLSMKQYIETTLKVTLSSWEIKTLEAIIKWERYEKSKEKSTGDETIEKIYNSYEENKEYLFEIKTGLVNYVNELLFKKSIKGWDEILYLFMRSEIRELKGYFWEFYIMNYIFDIYKEERERYYSSGMTISVLQFCKMETLLDTYFQLVFYLRRLEYGIESETHTDIIKDIKRMNISDIFINHVLNDGNITDKEKVKEALRNLW